MGSRQHGALNTRRRQKELKDETMEDDATLL